MQPAVEELTRSVLIAVHGPDIGALLEEAAAAEGVAILRATDAEGALAIARAEKPSIVLLEEDSDVHSLALPHPPARRALRTRRRRRRGDPWRRRA